MVKRKHAVDGQCEHRSGRPTEDLQTTKVKKHSPFQVRDLFGLEKPAFKLANFNASQPQTFLTIVTFVFFVTRLLMDTNKDFAIDWKNVVLDFSGVDLHGYYSSAIRAVAVARNGTKKLRMDRAKVAKFPLNCQKHLGTHCTLPEIMYCSQIHGMRPSLKDPLTAATTQWLEASIGNPAEMSNAHWLTLKAFGKLRQASSVNLLTVGHPQYIGFATISSVHNLGDFIAAQDSVTFRQQQTQEMSKIPGANSAKASIEGPQSALEQGF